MARSSIPGPDEALAGMARIGAPREPMGNAPYSNVVNASAATGNAIPVPRRDGKAGDPSMPGSKADRAYGSANRNGARYGIAVNYAAPVPPEAAPTQANGRIVRAATNRDRVNFDMGTAASMV